MIGFTFLVALAAILAVLVLRIRLHQVRGRLTALEEAHFRLERRLASRESKADSTLPAREAAVQPEAETAPVVPTPSIAAVLLATRRAEETTGLAPNAARETAPPRLAPIAQAASAGPAADRPVAGKDGSDSKPAGLSAETREWEQFMGARLFAWLGGLALFLGVAYFVKYSFDRNLVPPALRVVVGLATGIGLLGAGLRLGQRAYAVTSQTLCATGVVILYASLFAGHAMYQLSWLPQGVTFAAMVVVTAVAFLLAIRLSAKVVAILGWVGGFLTPLLLSTGQDQPVALFVYVGLLDLGLLAVVLYRRWDFLAVLGAVGTVVLQAGWVAKFYDPTRLGTAWTIFAAFNVLFVGALAGARRTGRDSDWLGGATAVMAVATLAFGGWLLSGGGAAGQPAGLFSLVLVADLALLAVAYWRMRLAGLFMAAGMVVFGYLAYWQAWYVDGTLLGWTLGFSLVFAVMHTIVPPWLKISWNDKTGLTLAQVIPSVALATLVIPIIRLPETSFALWPTLLLVDLMALGLAGWVGGVAGALAALVLTGVAGAVWIARLPVAGVGTEAGTLAVVAVTAAMFVMVGGWVLARVRDRQADSGATTRDEDLAELLPAAATVMPFGLMAQLVVRIPMPSPMGISLVSLAIAGLLLAVTWHRRHTVLPLAGLAGASMVQWVWLRDEGALTDQAGAAVVWALIVFASFAVFPHLFRERVEKVRGTWIAAALAVLPPFYVAYRLVSLHWPNRFMGAIPLLFAAPAVAAFLRVKRYAGGDEKIDRERLAWFGGVVLFLVTVAVPIQFDREVLTVAWALEGVALIGWFSRVPYRGLRDLGGALLILVFFRLCLNPTLLEGVVRGPRPLWNPWWYTFGLSLVSMGLAARWSKPTDHLFGRLPLRPTLNCLAVITLFGLVNLEIADFFTPEGSAVRFEFSAGFAADMTYTIAWALFALGLVGFGIARRLVSVRWAGLGLLAVAVSKLFLHDLARLDQLYRVGALIGVALIAITASMLYQRFAARESAPIAPRS
jgi:uncharacterized membrane protein